MKYSLIVVSIPRKTHADIDLYLIKNSNLTKDVITKMIEVEESDYPRPPFYAEEDCEPETHRLINTKHLIEVGIDVSETLKDETFKRALMLNRKDIRGDFKCPTITRVFRYSYSSH